MIHCIRMAMIAMLALAPVLSAQAQSATPWPAKAIRMIIPVPPGGGMLDVTATFGFLAASTRTLRFGTGVALVLIVVYNEIIHQGASLSNHGVASPLVTMWLPCLLLALFTAWRYIGTCFTLRNDPVSSVIDRVGDFFGGLRHGKKNRHRQQCCHHAYKPSNCRHTLLP